MEISLRDERGQGVVEYLLVLIVAVGIILGMIYQLNSAFKVWANNYFGNYLACLLETGELPTLGGSSPGDSGVCNQVFKPFNLAEGRPLIAGKGSGGGEESESKKGNGSGSRETGPGSGGGGGGYTRLSSSGSFRGGLGGNPGLGTSARGAGSKGDSTYTGSTGVSQYGGGYGALNRRLSTSTKIRLDQRFAFDDSRERLSRRPAGASAKASLPEAARKTSIRINRSDAKKTDSGDGPDSGFSIGNFLRFLLLAAIIIAVVVFLGGQGLQIGKSME